MNLCLCLPNLFASCHKFDSTATEADNSIEHQDQQDQKETSFKADKQTEQKGLSLTSCSIQIVVRDSFFTVSYAKPSQSSPGYDNYYEVKIASRPYCESIKTVYSRFSTIQSPPFERWSSSEIELAGRRLDKLRMPLNPNFTILIYKLLKSNGQALCQNYNVTYPARYKVLITYEKVKSAISTLNPLNSTNENKESSLKSLSSVAKEDENRGAEPIKHRRVNDKYFDGVELEIYSESKASLIFKRRECHICKGSYKSVWKVFSLDTTEKKAMAISIPHLEEQQRVDKGFSHSKSNSYHKQASREEDCFKTFQHRLWIAHVDRIFYYKDTSNPIPRQQQVIEMKYYPRTLFDIILGKGNVPTSTENKLNYSKVCISAIADLHSQGLIYGDLKPENILINSEGAFLTDFGLCMRRSDPDFFREHGTFMYCAPEMLQKNKELYGPPLDIWSLGTVLWILWFDDTPPWQCLLEEIEIARRIFPLMCSQQLINKIREFSQMSTEDLKRTYGNKNLQLRILIQKMLRPDPADRPTASDVLVEFTAAIPYLT